MRIDITITMGNDSKVMSLDEARGLYMELGQLFGSNTDTQYVPSQPIYRDTDINVEPEHNPKEINSKPKRDDSHGANPKVEAARNRAARATSGCGSRR